MCIHETRFHDFLYLIEGVKMFKRLSDAQNVLYSSPLCRSKNQIGLRSVHGSAIQFNFSIFLKNGISNYVTLKIRKILFMAKKDIFVHYSVFLSNRKNAVVGIFCFSIFPLLNRKLTSSPWKFLFFYVWQKMEKSQLRQFFCYVFHILANWRDVIEIYTQTIY